MSLESAWEEVVIISRDISVISTTIIISTLFVTDYWNFDYNFSTWKIWIFYNYCDRSIYISTWCYNNISVFVDFNWNIFSVFILSRNICIFIWIFNIDTSVLFFISWVNWIYISSYFCIIFRWCCIFYCYRYFFFFT